MSKLMNTLKRKWNIKNNTDFFLIMAVFSLAGMIIGFERKPIFHLFGINAQTPVWLKILFYISCIPFIYQINLVLFGFLLGKFEFFWEREKKIGRFLKRIFIR